MPARERWLRSGAAAAVAGLVLVGCSAEETTDNDGVAGVDAANPSEPTDAESEEPDADDGVDRPDIETPDDLISIFEEAATDDPVEQEILADQEHQINALDETITSGEFDRPGLAFYTTDRALRSDIEYALSFHEDGQSIAGTNRYYNRTVEIFEEGRAEARYCMDPSEAYMYDIESGEEFPNADIRTQYIAILEKNDIGVWQTVMYFQDEEPEEC